MNPSPDRRSPAAQDHPDDQQHRPEAEAAVEEPRTAALPWVSASCQVITGLLLGSVGAGSAASITRVSEACRAWSSSIGMPDRSITAGGTCRALLAQSSAPVGEFDGQLTLVGGGRGGGRSDRPPRAASAAARAFPGRAAAARTSRLTDSGACCHSASITRYCGWVRPTARGWAGTAPPHCARPPPRQSTPAGPGPAGSAGRAGSSVSVISTCYTNRWCTNHWCTPTVLTQLMVGWRADLPWPVPDRQRARCIVAI